MDELEIVEVPFQSGVIQYRLGRCRDPQNGKWVKYGPFQAYHQNGNIASDGYFKNDAEDGEWTDYHDNRNIAAKGLYRAGRKVGVWKYWDRAGNLEEEEDFNSVSTN